MESVAKKLPEKVKEKLPVTGPYSVTVKELMVWYCNYTNTHGCRRIVVSRGRLRRWIWTVLTLSAVALISWQCALLIQTYYSSSVSVTVQFQTLTFPAVTVCNLNPLRYSATKQLLTELDGQAERALQELYSHKEPTENRKRRGLVTDKHAEDGQVVSNLLKDIPLFWLDKTKFSAALAPNYRKRTYPEKFLSKSGSHLRFHEAQRQAGFQLCNSTNITDCVVYAFDTGINAVQEWYWLHFNNIIAQQSLETLVKMGYSAEEFISTCTFNGAMCSSRNFTQSYHPTLGNCYTFNSGYDGEIIQSSTAGSKNGLIVVLNLGLEDYNPFLSSSEGAIIMIHNQNEHPFIEDLGIMIQMAKETSIGLQFMESHKLGEPYSSCTEDGTDVSVNNLYNKTYSLQKWVLQTLGLGNGLKKKQNISKENFAKFSIFYKDLNLKTITESPLNNIVTLLSNVGGQLGLWLSCSIVCVIEIIEVFFLDAPWILVRQIIRRCQSRYRERQQRPVLPTVSGGIPVDEDPPTFNTALRLPQPNLLEVPKTPPPNYNTLRIHNVFSHMNDEDEHDTITPIDDSTVHGNTMTISQRRRKENPFLIMYSKVKPLIEDLDEAARTALAKIHTYFISGKVSELPLMANTSLVNFSQIFHHFYGNCYIFNWGLHDKAISSSNPGGEFGLNVVLDINQKEYIPFLSTTAGARLLVHEQKSFPFLKDLGIFVLPGTETSIGISVDKIEHMEAPYSDCTQNGSDVPVTDLFYKMYATSYSVQVVWLLSNLGGQFGLWMGGSVICIVEFGEIIIDCLWITIIKLIMWNRNWKLKKAQSQYLGPPPSISQLAEGHMNTGFEPDNVTSDSGQSLQTMSSCEHPVHPIPGTPPPHYDSLRLKSVRVNNE
ncbi:SCNNG protein, partial [Polypterus senegalus]